MAKRGRPRKNSEDKMAHFTITLPEPLKIEFCEFTKENHLNKSSLICSLIEAYLEEIKKK